MKRILFIAAMLCGSISLLAQEAGDHYLGASFVTSFSDSQTTSPEFSVEVGGEFAYFPFNHFRVGIAVGVPFHYYKDIHNHIMLGAQINPNFAYYVKLADKLYYSPEIGGAFEIGSFKREVYDIYKYKEVTCHYQGWEAYLHFFALEFRVNKRFALGVNIGSMVYSTVKTEWHANFEDNKDTNSSVQLSFNNSSVQARFYF